jgi:hypothetical protein
MFGLILDWWWDFNKWQRVRCLVVRGKIDESAVKAYCWMMHRENLTSELLRLLRLKDYDAAGRMMAPLMIGTAGAEAVAKKLRKMLP